jgi:DNA gyrase subunit A
MEIGTIKPVRIEEEVKVSYLDYAMSVIISRALPDVRDGLKPVHRRILYAMNDLGLHHTSPYKKSARIVGEVLGKYHPHGDAPVYESLVRMAQDFSMRYTLVAGQGNFGSLDRDPPAAMRYTEARLAGIAQEMLVDIDKDTVDFSPNFDASLREPVVLSARLPNLLVNGSSGIAVGMATNIAPHNLSEVCDAITFLIANPDASVDELIEIVPGPDFPTGGIIFGLEGLQKAYSTGQGKVVIRAKVDVEEMTKGRHQIVITEVPYQTNKAEMVERIAELVKEKRIDGVSELRDESDRKGLRVVIELRREIHPEQILNNLYKYTAMQSAFYVNMLALVDGQPRVINLKEALQYFIDFRHEVIVRRSNFELQQATSRAHILEGLKIAIDQIDQVITTIRRAKSAEEAKSELMSRFSLSQIQAQAILDMQLRRLAALERQKILDEHTQVLKTIAYLEDLLANPKKILFLIKQETEELKSKHGDSRRTQFSDTEISDFREEDLIPHQEMAVTLSTRGYIKRVPSETYKLQHRGGKGVSGMVTKEVDTAHIFLSADTHDMLLLFSNTGKMFSLKCYRLPQDISRTAKGTPLINLLPLEPKEQITAAIALSRFVPGEFVILVTRKGKVKRTPVEKFSSMKSRGLIAVSLEKGDELVAVTLAGDGDEVILVTEKGQAIRFAVSTLRVASRTSRGVRGIRLAPNDKVVSMVTASPGACLLTVTANGFGKLTRTSFYTAHHRGGKGLLSHRVTEKTGEVVAAKQLTPSGELMLISANGIIIRVLVESIRVQQRVTQGVSLMRIEPGNRVVSIAYLEGKAVGQDKTS